jgi:hypothetical protein
MEFILAGVALFGFLPFFVILYRKRKFERMRDTGIATTGIIRSINGFSYRGLNHMQIEYRVKETGQVIKKDLVIAGLPYTVGQELPMFYDPVRPTRMRLDMKKSFLPMIVFTLLIAGAVVFAAWKLLQMV